ncbi:MULTISPECIES: hypothetical protein [Polaromonas]|uniref:Uncharacterized protein n=1 Tax=Polaromonas aquatica TaxID=332657 RepID=A0ABW1TZ74_9BURK
MKAALMNGDWLSKLALVLDPYERRARLTPAFLCLSPLIVMAAAMYLPQLRALAVLSSVIGGIGLVYLLADVARSMGKRHEKALWNGWGGSPSTQALRHRDDMLDAPTTARYHQFLAKKINNPFPTVQEEATDPAAADGIYSAGCGWLRENTRDTKKFSLLFHANVTYGFRRNGYGLRWIGFLISLLIIAWVVIRRGVFQLPQRISAAPNLEAIFSADEVVTLLFAVVMLLMWLFYFSESRVREAGDSYALRLVSACDALMPKSAPRQAPASKKASS